MDGTGPSRGETCSVPRKRPTHLSTQLWARGGATHAGVARLLQQATSRGDPRASLDTPGRTSSAFLPTCQSLSGPGRARAQQPLHAKVGRQLSRLRCCHCRASGLGASFLTKLWPRRGPPGTASLASEPGIGISQLHGRPPPSPPGSYHMRAKEEWPCEVKRVSPPLGSHRHPALNAHVDVQMTCP